MRGCLLATFILLGVSFAEPSAFERQSGATKDDIKKMQGLITKLQQKIDSLQQLQEGVSSLYESQNSKIQQQSIQNTTLSKDIEELRTQIDLNTKDIKAVQTQLGELSQLILKELDNLNTHKTDNKDSKTSKDSKDTKQADSKDAKETKPESSLEQAQKSDKPSENTAKSKSSAPKVVFEKDKTKSKDIFLEAQGMFQSRDYNEAKPRLEWLIEINYRKAISHFYLGEIAFNKKQHDTAIYHYKQSAIANENAKYMPTLLLHTAQSFNAIKDTKNYNMFLDSLISNYPHSNEAKSAKKLKSKDKK